MLLQVQIHMKVKHNSGREQCDLVSRAFDWVRMPIWKNIPIGIFLWCQMTKAQRTRLHIIEKTAPLFNMNGFDGTSLADLCRVTGLTKGALYGNFLDKEELATEAFR